MRFQLFSVLSVLVLVGLASATPLNLEQRTPVQARDGDQGLSPSW